MRTRPDLSPSSQAAFPTIPNTTANALERHTVFPKRGAIALGLTGIALVLLVAFRRRPTAAPRRPGDPASAATGGVDRGRRTVRTDQRVDRHERLDRHRGAGGHPDRGRPGRGHPLRPGPGRDHARRLDDHGRHRPPAAGRGPAVRQINNRAEPALQSEALQAQSANIDGVSGATYTSEAYAQSLQAALDNAGI